VQTIAACLVGRRRASVRTRIGAGCRNSERIACRGIGAITRSDAR